MAKRTPQHLPVLLREVCDALKPGLAACSVFVDATCGLGGHTEAIVERFAPERVVVFDRDPAALALTRERLASRSTSIEFVQAPFSTLAERLAELGITAAGAILADIGVSSMQLDTAERGFSLRADAPLDMRMDPTSGRSAADVIATIDAAELTRILREYGEEPDAGRIARAIVDARPQSTVALAGVVAAAMSAPQRRKLGRRIHPATRTFQALRIHVNAELDELDQFLRDAPNLLAPGGRLGVITFHSLEDRRVKKAMRSLSKRPEPPPHVPVRDAELPPAPFALPSGYGQGVVATPEEIDANPRARSARLRVLERCADE